MPACGDSFAPGGEKEERLLNSIEVLEFSKPTWGRMVNCAFATHPNITNRQSKMADLIILVFRILN